MTNVGGNWMTGFARLALAALLAITASELAHAEDPMAALNPRMPIRCPSRFQSFEYARTNRIARAASPISIG